MLVTLLGTALSSLINTFLRSQGQISAVGTIVSSGYGFLCGAYMPTSQFGEGLQKAVSFLPGTYGTVLMRRHAMGGALAEFAECGFPEEAIRQIMNVLDCSLEFMGRSVSIGAMYVVMAAAVIIVTGAYVAICRAKKA